MNDSGEFAEEYSASERRRFVLTGVIAGAVLVAFGKMWFFPWLQAFSESAACSTIFGLNGAEVLFYGLFVGLPLALSAGIGLSSGLRGYRILRDGRVPPEGEKVFRKTRIVRGPKANLIGKMHVLAVAFPLILTVWGFTLAQRLSAGFAAQPQNCAVLPVYYHK